MSVLFNGVNQYARLPNAINDAASRINATKACSFVVWFKPLGGVTKQWIGGSDNGTVGSGFTRFMGTTFRGDTGNSVTYARSSLETHTTLAASVVLSQWHVAVWSRPAGFPALLTYAVDTADGSQSGVGGSNDYEARGFSLAGRADSNPAIPVDWFFNGYIGAWAIYNGTLSSQDIDSLQNGAKPNEITATPLDYMILTGTNGATATTALSNAGFTLTYTGSPTYSIDTPFPTALINSVNGGAGITAGSASNTAITTGFVSPPTSGSFGGKAITITGYNAGTGVVTFTMPPYTDLASYPVPIGSYTLTLQNGSETASLNTVPLNLATGYSSVLVNSPNIINDKYIGYWDNEVVTGDYYLYPNEGGDFEVLPDSGVSAQTEGVRIVWRYDVSTALMLQLNVTINDAGEIVIVVPESDITYRVGWFQAMIEIAEGSSERTKLPFMANSVATTEAQFRTDFNNLLTSMRANGWFESA